MDVSFFTCQYRIALKVEASSQNAACVSMRDILNARDGLSDSIHFSFMVRAPW